MMEIVATPPDPTYQITMSANKEETDKILNSNAPGLRAFYEKYVQEDGSILVPAQDQSGLEATEGVIRKEGSADDSPVFFINREGLCGVRFYEPLPDYCGVFFCRGIFASAKNGQIFQEASVALGVAASAMRRSPADGAWIAIRFFDMFPGIEDFLAVIRNWLNAIEAALQSIIDTIKKYIEFIEARIIELQQLIQRINAIIQSLLGFAFQIPKSAALLLISQGTGGVIADLMSAQNKPSDSPLAYGAGIAVVIPFGPDWVMQLLQMIFATSSGSPQPGEMMAAPPPAIPAAIGLEALPPPPPPPGDNTPPDVL
jgi:hypothetical protein